MPKIFQCLYRKYRRILDKAGIRATKSLSTHVKSVSPQAEGRTDKLTLLKVSARRLAADREAHSSEEATFSLPSAH